MARRIIPLIWVAVVVTLSGCGVGVVSSQQQADKANAIHKFVQDHAKGPHERRSDQ